MYTTPWAVMEHSKSAHKNISPYVQLHVNWEKGKCIDNKIATVNQQFKPFCLRKKCIVTSC